MGVYRRKLAKRGERWYYRGTYLAERYHSKAIYLTRKEARTAEAERIREMDEQARNPVKDIKLLDLCNARLDLIQSKNSRFYYRENHRYFKKLNEFTGNIYVSGVTKQIINDLLMAEAKRLKAAGKGNTKVNSMIRSLKALFNWGNRVYDLKTPNPLNWVGFWPIAINLKHIPAEEEVKRVRESLSDRQRLLFDFVDQTGCRIMEAIRLKAEDLDGNLLTLWTRKSKNSNLTPRRIPLPDCFIGLKLPRGKVFTGWTEYPRFLEEKTQGKWTWHSLRHRRASIWANSGMTTFEIMVRLGHSNLSTTMKYLQLLGFTRQ